MDPQQWYKGLPAVTRYWLTAAVASALFARFGVISASTLAFYLPHALRKLQLWRFISTFLFFGGPSFPWLINMVMLSRYVPALEDNPYPSCGGSRRGNLADFLYMLLFGGGVLLFIAWCMTLPFMAQSLFFMVIYLWSKREPERDVTFYVFHVKSQWLPWVMVAFSFIVGDDPVKDLLGIAAGHLYFFLQETLPGADTPLKGRFLLATPLWLYRVLGLPSTDAAAAAVRMRDQAAAAAGVAGGPRYFQGQGQRLGY